MPNLITSVARISGARPTVDVAAVITCMTESERPFLQETIRSVCDQTYPCREIIVVVNQSNTWAEDDLRHFPTITILRIPPSYAGGARNAGARASSAEFVGFLDGDDLWCPTKVEKQAGFLEVSGENFVAVDHLLMNENGQDFAVALARHLPMPSSWMVRRDLIMEYPFDPSISSGIEDGEWWLRTYHLIKKIRIPEPLIRYRVRGSSLSSLSPSKRKKLLVARIASLPLLRSLIFLATSIMHRRSRSNHYIPAKSWSIGATTAEL